MKEDQMKKLATVGIIGLAIFCISVPIAYPQSDKEIVSKKEAQAEVAADSDSYVIGPEDVLYIHVYGEEKTLSKEVIVRIDGKISMPLVDDIQAAGLTPLQLKGGLTDRLKKYVESPTVTVIVMQANSFKVYVSGQVKTPGVIRLRTETTLAQAISMVGGFTDWANQKKIIVIRKENGKEKRFTINYKKIINGEDLNANILLKSGDTIIVP
jgi:polysaccharide export outer membrane protein